MSKSVVKPVVSSFKSVEDEIRKLRAEHEKKVNELRASVSLNINEYLDAILPEIRKMNEYKNCLSFYKEYNKFNETFKGAVKKTNITFNICLDEQDILLREEDDSRFAIINVKLKGVIFDVSSLETREVCSEVLGLVPEAYKTYKKMPKSLNSVSELTVENALAYINSVKTLRDSLKKSISLDIEFRLNSDGEMDIVCTNPPNKVAKAVIESNIYDMLDDVYTEDVFKDYFDAVGEFLPNSLHKQFRDSFSQLINEIKLAYPAIAHNDIRSELENKLSAKLGFEGI